MTTAPKQAVLPEFEGHDVHRCQVRITRAGDGLSEALQVAPKAIDIGDRVFYVLEGICGQINHRLKDDVIVRVHTIEATGVTEVDESTAKQLLAAAAEHTERRKAEIAGQLMLGAEKAAEDAEHDQEDEDDDQEDDEDGDVDDDGHRVHILHPNPEGARADQANPKATRRRPS